MACSKPVAMDTSSKEAVEVVAASEGSISPFMILGIREDACIPDVQKAASTLTEINSQWPSQYILDVIKKAQNDAIKICIKRKHQQAILIRKTKISEQLQRIISYLEDRQVKASLSNSKITCIHCYKQFKHCTCQEQTQFIAEINTDEE